jgi:7-carboxy-7-deazaguanine synthase
MIINEIFYSLQGEGSLAGSGCVFIRLPGCKLRCKWCDTKYAWDVTAGDDYDIEKIKEKVLSWQCRHLIITGGEPMTNPDLPELLNLFAKKDFHITIETSGTEFIANLSCSLMSISPKLSNASPKIGLNLPALQLLIDNYRCQLKFVVDSPSDIDEIKNCLAGLKNVPPNNVYLMPQAASRAEYIEKSQMTAQLCKETGFNFSPRLQVMLWNNKKGS